MCNASVYLFVDNSNIFISAKSVAALREGRPARDTIRLHFENLISLAIANRPLGHAFVVGSIPPEQRAVWDSLTASTGIVPELYERGGLSGCEQGLDQCLQVHMLRAISDNSMPLIAVLLTGDGAGYDTGVGFHADIKRMRAAGWGIEVLSWSQSCRKTLREWATANGCFIELDTYYKSITFIEGGRRPEPLNLSKRPMARICLSASQQDEEKSIQQTQKKIESLERELLELKKQKANKDRRRKKYNKMMERRRRKKAGS